MIVFVNYAIDAMKKIIFMYSGLFYHVQQEKQSYYGYGNVEELRFVQTKGTIYPLFNHKILTYYRHKNDKACLLIPDYEFING